ncbi:MAG: Gfo/Idh/MocA family oxidoreductase [Clostridiales bacterium]|nr:Gfo/Idh/MocA family oxidoreductase [Clostridiales bacterium]
MKEKVRFGLVGLGAMGLAHAKTLLTAVPEATLSAVATRNAPHIAQLRALPGGDGVRVFDTPAQMYGSGEIDAVLIASPHRLHVAQATEAFAAGVPVLLEKPTGVFTREVRALNASADKSGLPFGVMFNQRTSPVYRRMRELVASGELGELRRTSVIITDWFRAQSYYDSGAWRATWRHDGGGVLLNQAPHNLDLWQWICGMPTRVHAFCGMGRWHDIEVEDDVTAYVEYPNGATGTFVTCTGEAAGTNRFEISLDGGQLVYEHGRLTLSRPSVPASQFIREYTGGFGKPEIRSADITPIGEYTMHAGVLRAFARHMLFGEPMVADGREGLESLSLANAMLLSAWTGETVALPMSEADDARYEAMLASRAAKSREKTARPVELDVNKSF